MRRRNGVAIAIIVATLVLIGLSFDRGSESGATIVVNSTADIVASDGTCTLREAIEASNSDWARAGGAGECAAGAGADTIEFDLSGPPDFLVAGARGYRIQPRSPLPRLLDRATMDGYSQPGARPNAAVSPEPLDGVLLVQIDGSMARAGTGVDVRAAGSQIRGLVVSNWDFDGVSADADDVVVAGNYIGTNANGTAAEPNRVRGIAGWGVPGHGVRVGGVEPADRNLISGNGTSVQGGGLSMGGGHDAWVIQGNYIGLGADGLTPIPNAVPEGSGSPSVDQVSGTLVGGSSPEAANVISGNNGHGIAPFEAPDTIIQGNLIGTDYTGLRARPNGGAGITIHDSPGTQVLDNTVAASKGDGLVIVSTVGTVVQANRIGTDAQGTGDLGNGGDGIAVISSSEVLVGGPGPGDGNVIANSTSGVGVRVGSQSRQVSILGNMIRGNGVPQIDLGGDGVTGNDLGDADDGANDVLNHPEDLVVVPGSEGAAVSFRLDVPAGTYRVEFFGVAPDGADGLVLLGSTDVVHLGEGAATFEQVFAGGVDLTDGWATATPVDSSADGFGGTSEPGGAPVG